MEALKILKDVVTFAQKSNDIDMVQKIIAAQQEIIDLQEKVFNLNNENSELKEKIKQNSEIIRYRSVPIISLKNDNSKILYCSNCFGNDNKLIQIHIIDKKHSYCRICTDQSDLSKSADYELLKEFLD